MSTKTAKPKPATARVNAKQHNAIHAALTALDSVPLPPLNEGEGETLPLATVKKVHAAAVKLAAKCADALPKPEAAPVKPAEVAEPATA